MVLLGATTPGQSGPASDGYEGVFHIPQISSITGNSQSDCLVSYLVSYPTTSQELVYSTASADWGKYFLDLTLYSKLPNEG